VKDVIVFESVQWIVYGLG